MKLCAHAYQFFVLIVVVISASSVQGASAPTIATAAAGASPITGTSVPLSVLGADSAGESTLKYTWATTGTPPAAVTFSANGTNAAKSTTATFTKIGTYAFQVTVADTLALTATSSVTVVVNAVPASIAVTPASATINPLGTIAPLSQQYTATGTDQFGASMGTVAATWSATGSSGTISTGGLFTSNATSGGPLTVTATYLTKTATATVTVNAKPTIVTVAAATAVTGTTSQLSVLGADDGGEPNLKYTWATTGTPPAAVTFSANGTNAAKSTTATFTKIGTYVFQVTVADTLALTATSSVTVVVNAAPASIAVTPASATINPLGTIAPLSQQYTATGTDQFGASMGTVAATWNATGTSGTISTGGLFTSNATSGGPLTVTATYLTKTATATVTVNAKPTIATAAAGASPLTGTSVPLSVLGADSAGESTLKYTWATTGTPPAAVTFSANGTNAAKSTTATFTKIGTYVFQVTVADTLALTVTSSVTVVVNAAPASIAVTPASATINPLGTIAPLSQQFTATGTDQFGASMGTVATTWAVTGSSGTISTSGLFTSNSTSGGPLTVTATYLTKTATATVTVNAKPTIATAAAGASPITGTSVPLSVLGADSAGESTLKYTWTTTGTPPAAVTFSANGTNAAKLTTATFTKIGTYAFQVTVADTLALTVTSSVTVVVNAAPASIAVTPASATINPLGTIAPLSQQFTATGTDQFGASMGTVAATWAVTGSSGTMSTGGLFTSNATSGGPLTITATYLTKTATATVTVNAKPTITTVAAATAVTGTTSQLSVLGADDGGEPNLKYTWTTTGTPPAAVTFSANGTNAAKSTMATFTKIGTYVFQVTVADTLALTATSSVTVVVNAVPASIAVTPASATINPLGTIAPLSQQYTATGTDQFGASMGTVAATWAVTGSSGTISTGGLFTSNATSGGPLTVTATYSTKTATATVTVNGKPTIVTVAAATAVTGTTSQLSVLGADDGGEPNLKYAWTTTGTPPAAATFSANGTNAAKSTTATFTKIGTYVFQVTVADTLALTATSSVTVVVNAVPASIAVTPASATINPLGTIAPLSQQYTATGTDQFGASMGTVAATWAVTGSSGTISTGGLFTSNATSGGPLTVTATYSTKTATATVTVNAKPTIATAAAGASPITGTSVPLSVLGADSAGESTLKYTWTTTGTPPAAVTFSANGTNAAKSTTATFTKIGTYVFQVTVANTRALTATSSKTITVNASAAGIAVSPASATINPLGTIAPLSQQFTARGTDQFGVSMGTVAASWSVIGGTGLIDSTGLYTANSGVGVPITIKAMYLSKVATARVNINASPSVSAAASASPSTVTGTSTALSVLGADDGGETNLSYEWTTFGTSPGTVTFSPNSSNAAKNTTANFTMPGSYTFQVIIKDQAGLSTKSLITVEVISTPTSLGVLPASATLQSNGSAAATTQQFTATITDQFNTNMAVLPIIWSSASSSGSINTNGLFTSNGTGGTTSTVTASYLKI